MMNSPPFASVVSIAAWVEGSFDAIPEPAAGKVLVASGVDELLAVDGAGEPLLPHPKNRKPTSETTTPAQDFSGPPERRRSRQRVAHGEG